MKKTKNMQFKLKSDITKRTPRNFRMTDEEFRLVNEVMQPIDRNSTADCLVRLLIAEKERLSEITK